MQEFSADVVEEAKVCFKAKSNLSKSWTRQLLPLKHLSDSSERRARKYTRRTKSLCNNKYKIKEYFKPAATSGYIGISDFDDTGGDGAGDETDRLDACFLRERCLRFLLTDGTLTGIILIPRFSRRSSIDSTGFSSELRVLEPTKTK